MALTLARLVWKGHRPAVREVPGLRRWELAAAKSAHWLRYALLLALPLSGLLMSQGAGRPTPVFGVFAVPQMLPLDPSLAPREQVAYRLGKLLHGSIFNWLLNVVLFLHIAGASIASLTGTAPTFAACGEDASEHTGRGAWR